MAGQTWLADLLAAVMIATAIYCLGRLTLSWRQGRPTDRPVDAVHVLMGVAMAGMLVPRLRVFWAGGWEVVFGLGALGFAWLAARELRSPSSERSRPRHHHLQHVLACVAMVYMLAAVGTVARAGSGMSGMAGGAAHFPTVALLLALALSGYVIWTADRLTSLAPVAVLAAASTAVPDLVPDLVPAGGGAASAVSSAGPSEAASAPGMPARPLSPRLAACCEIAMGLTMGYMLIMVL